MMWCNLVPRDSVRLIWTHGRLTSGRDTPFKVVNACMRNKRLIAVRGRLLDSGENWVTWPFEQTRS